MAFLDTCSFPWPPKDVQRLALGLFGVNLLQFNFFMPLVFSADIPDLLIRTGVDTLSVLLGCLCVAVISAVVQRDKHSPPI